MLRNDSAFLDAVGADSIPDPTTAGDFCRRFSQQDIDALMTAINEAPINVWKQQDASFFEQANIDVDGVLVATTGECKQDMDITYKGSWGYHPLFGYEARDNLKAIADELPESAWKKLSRALPARLTDQTRAKPKNIKREIIRKRGYVHMELLHEEVAVEEEHQAEHRAEKKRLLTMEFRTFQTAIIHVPCQIIRHARQTIHRVMNWNDYTPAFFRLCKVLNL